MKKILLVKTSSLGDVVHNLPVVSDILERFPQATVDWMVEEAYSGLVRMHPRIHRVVPVAVRRWRRSLLSAETWRELASWRKVMQIDSYDTVIDTQGLLKSAVLASVVPGRKHGFDSMSARERMASQFYDECHHVPRDLHAVARNRLLVGAALGYRPEAPADYGISRTVPNRRSRVVFLHSTSREDKRWPDEHWIDLGRRLEGRGIELMLPWGSEGERARSESIARHLPRATVPPAMSVQQLAGAIAESRAVVGVDTGLVHLAAALAMPVVAIYCSSNPALTGTHGAESALNVGGPGRIPSVKEVGDSLEMIAAL